MDVSLTTLGWCGLAVLLFIGSFGPQGGLYIIFLVLLPLFGVLIILYRCANERAKQWIISASADEWKPPPKTGFKRLLVEVLKGKPKLKIDKRMTGSSVIDDVLQELLIYTYRDYIHQWYSKISDDDQFQYDIRQTLQRVVIAFSERAKDVDLVPYLTRRLVDDFASHIRLYRRTLKKMLDDKNDSTKPPPNMESIFFDLELEMENNISRDQICLQEESERQYLQELSEVLMFLLLPAGDFHNKLFRYITREVLVNGILLPTINLVSDPDFINQTISWLCKESMLTSESLLTILKTSDNIDELQAMREKVDMDIARQRSKDSGGDDDTIIKQQLSSLTFVRSVCDQRIQQLKDGVVDDADLILPGGVDVTKLLGADQQLYSLSFDVILNNAVALSYFIEYMTGIGAQNYLFFYLTVEGYRVSAEQQMSAALLSSSSLHQSDLDTLSEAAMGIYNQYLSDKATPKLKIDDQSIKSVLERIEKGQNLDTVFDSIQSKVCMMLQQDHRFFGDFKKSALYIKLLMELDLFTAESKAEDALSLEEDNHSLASLPGSIKEDSPTEDGDSVSSSEGAVVAASAHAYTLHAHISNTGICREHGKAYTVYLITVVKKLADGTERTWDIYRRYSDFYDLHMILQNKFNSISAALILPKKKAFDNMNKEFLEKRRIGLNTYLQSVLNPTLLSAHKGLLETIYEFLENMHWEREKTDLERKVNTIVNPLRSSVRNVTNMVRSMPDNLVDGVARVSGGFRNIPNNMIDGVGRMLNVKGTAGLSSTAATAVKTNGLESGKVSASLDVESDEDSIPLHIMLLLMDEVFDLKTRNQWLRRRIVAILQQIAKTMFGDSINRRIVETVAYMTAPDQIAEYIRHFRDAHWPNGSRAESQPERDLNTKMRCRVVCKSKLYGHFSEELQHLIGSETTRQGVMLVFSMFQHRQFNRRLVYVVLEGLLETIFPDNKFDETFRKIHSTSPRVAALKKDRKSFVKT